MLRLASLLLILGLPSLAAAAPPVLAGLGDLPNHCQSVPFAVSADGSVIAGHSDRCDKRTEAFRWTPSTGIQSLGDLDGGLVFSSALGISADGHVIVGFGTTVDGGLACRWTDGAIALLPDLPGGNLGGGALAASANGSVIVGAGLSDLGSEGVVWVADQPSRVGDVTGGGVAGGAVAVSADGSVIFGVRGGGSGAYRSVNGVATDLGALPQNATNATVRSVSGSGAVAVGNIRFLMGPARWQEAFRWSGGVYTSIEPTRGPGASSDAYGISADGSIIVGVREPQGAQDWSGPFVWDARHGMRELRAVLRDDFAIDVRRWEPVAARAISADGRTIVGDGRLDGKAQAWRVVFDDSDHDGVVDYVDNCPATPNANQADADADGTGDACDDCVLVPNGPLHPDAGGHVQRDTDHDGYGNACDPDLDGNGIVNFADLAKLKTQFFTTSADADLDGDASVNFSDLAVMKRFFFKAPGPAAGKP